MPDPSSFLTINNTTAITNTGHYLSGYDVYNHNNNIQSQYYPLNTSRINHNKFKLATQGYVYDLIHENKSR
jgi:hypothetical protein